MVEWARCNETEFYKMLVRIMPREIHADEMAATGYNVINTVSSLKKLNVAKFVSVRTAFALHFKRLGRRN